MQLMERNEAIMAGAIDTCISCQELPTILNLLVPDCNRTAGGLTAADMAYLRALYKITPTANAPGQRDEMTYQMNKALGASR